MIRPASFGFNDETSADNVFMNKTDAADAVDVRLVVCAVFSTRSLSVNFKTGREKVSARRECARFVPVERHLCAAPIKRNASTAGPAFGQTPNNTHGF